MGGRTRTGAYFDLVTVRDQARIGAMTLGVTAIPGVVATVWLYHDIRTPHALAIGAVRLLLVAAFFIAMGLVFRAPFRRGMVTVGDLPEPVHIRQGWHNVPPAWYGGALLWFLGDGALLVYDLRHHGVNHHLSILSVRDLSAAWLYAMILYPAFLCVVLARTDRAVRQREKNEDVILLGQFDLIFGLGRDQRARTYLWPVPRQSAEGGGSRAV
jgi:hypothetical protein